jgi:hypothetical protein
VTNISLGQSLSCSYHTFICFLDDIERALKAEADIIHHQNQQHLDSETRITLSCTVLGVWLEPNRRLLSLQAYSLGR